MPVAFTQIIENIVGQQELNVNSQLDITPLDAYILIENTYAKLEALNYIKPLLLSPQFQAYFLR